MDLSMINHACDALIVFRRYYWDLNEEYVAEWESDYSLNHKVPVSFFKDEKKN